MIRDDREVVQSVLAEQPAFRSWLLVCLSEVRSIVKVDGGIWSQKKQL